MPFAWVSGMPGQDLTRPAGRGGHLAVARPDPAAVPSPGILFHVADAHERVTAQPHDFAFADTTQPVFRSPSVPWVLVPEDEYCRRAVAPTDTCPSLPRRYPAQFLNCRLPPARSWGDFAGPEWWAVDLGRGRLARITAYSVAIPTVRTWQLQGAAPVHSHVAGADTDAAGLQWHTIHYGRKRPLGGVDTYRVATHRGYRYFRLCVSGSRNRVLNRVTFLLVTAFELFGVLFEGDV